MTELRNFLLLNSSCKLMYGEPVTGPMLAELAISYAKADIPNIKDTWTNICETMCLGAFEEADNHLKQHLASVRIPCEDEKQLWMNL